MRKAIIELAQQRRHGQQPGLILQRYLTPAAAEKKDVERRALLDAAILAARNESLRAIYANAYARWNESFGVDDLDCTRELSTAPGRLIVGLGCENVLETGIRLHHTYGVPFVPGSALKGLASHYCDEVWGQRHLTNAEEKNRLFRGGERFHRLIFGTTDDGGTVAFHDAWITPASLGDAALRLDVMTPHHPKWQTNEAPPTVFDSPVPVSFLSVAGTFQIRLSWAGPVDTSKAKMLEWTNLTMNLLREALNEWSVGGKTSSGYGRLVEASTPRAPSRASQAGPTAVQRTSQPLHVPKLPASGDWVEAELLEQRTQKGGWKARHVGTGIAGPVINSSAVPADKQPGEKLTLIVHSAKASEISFKYPLPSDAQKREEQQRKPRDDRDGGKGGRGGPPRGGRR